MALTYDQKTFIRVFVGDGSYNFYEACAECGLPPSKVLKWFDSAEFLAALRAVERQSLQVEGFGPMRVVRELMAIAFSDVTEVRTTNGNLDQLPRRVRASLKKVEFKTDQNIVTGELVPYIKKVEMYDKTPALRLLAEWYRIAESPEVKATQQVTEDDNAPRRITGLVVRPPLSIEEKEIEDLLS